MVGLTADADGYGNGVALRSIDTAVKADLGACWEHEITLEKKLPLDPERTYPVCVAFAGDSPVEYPEEDYGDGPEKPEPFDLDEVNRRLAGDEDF